MPKTTPTFKELQTTKFCPRRPNPWESPKGTCGVYALSIITGLTPRYIDKFTPKKGWWGDAEMLRFLKSRGCQAYEISHASVHRPKREQMFENIYQRNINHLNVLLISQHMLPTEGSWAVVHNNSYYHGHERELFTGYELLTNPFWTGYVLWHPKWKTERSVLDKAIHTSLAVAGPRNLSDRKVEIYTPYNGEWMQVAVPKEKR
jgi:hypothetical protein